MKKAMHDAEAIRRCREGEVEAFRHLVQRYQRRALAHARALTGNDADAADAAQSAFLDAFRHLRRFDETREFYPWFYVLLRNRCFKRGAPRIAQAHRSLSNRRRQASIRQRICTTFGRHSIACRLTTAS